LDDFGNDLVGVGHDSNERELNLTSSFKLQVVWMLLFQSTNVTSYKRQDLLGYSPPIWVAFQRLLFPYGINELVSDMQNLVALV
jgi:hypothetical protein